MYLLDKCTTFLFNKVQAWWNPESHTSALYIHTLFDFNTCSFLLPQLRLSFSPSPDLFFSHLKEQNLFLFLIQLGQQLRLDVHISQYLLQHLHASVTQTQLKHLQQKGVSLSLSLVVWTVKKNPEPFNNTKEGTQKDILGFGSHWLPLYGTVVERAQSAATSENTCK